MIVDWILDRKDGEPYNAREFYHYCMGYMDGLGDDITRAMDGGTNADVQEMLCRYIMEQNYNPDICEYIRSKDWLENDKLNPMCEGCKGRVFIAEDGTRHIFPCSGTTEMAWTGCAMKAE